MASFASEVAENLPARREPQYPTEGCHRAYEQDWQQQITTFTLLDSGRLSVSTEFVFVTRGPKVGYKNLSFSPGLLL